MSPSATASYHETVPHLLPGPVLQAKQLLCLQLHHLLWRLCLLHLLLELEHHGGRCHGGESADNARPSRLQHHSAGGKHHRDITCSQTIQDSQGRGPVNFDHINITGERWTRAYIQPVDIATQDMDYRRHQDSPTAGRPTCPCQHCLSTQPDQHGPTNRTCPTWLHHNTDLVLTLATTHIDVITCDKLLQ